MTAASEKRVVIPGVVNLDLSLTESELQKGAYQVLEVVRPKWKREDIKFKVFTEGITNKLIGGYLKDDPEMNDCVLVRIYGQRTEILIDRNLELVTIYVLHMARFSAPLYCHFNNGIAYGFVPGTCVDVNSVRDPEIGKLVAQAIVALNVIDPLKYKDGLSPDAVAILNHLGDRTPSLFRRLKQFLTIIPQSFPEPERNKRFLETIPPLSKLQEEVQVMEKELSQLGSPIVFCHNDILLNNIVYNKKKGCCHIIDFEYAAFNYQAFDIANHFCEWAGVDEVDYSRYPDKPTQLRWLRHYLEAYKAHQGHSDVTPSEKELETLYVQVNKFSLASHLLWGIWGCVQARYSTIDFDFLEYAKIRLDEYFRTKQQFLALVLPK